MKLHIAKPPRTINIGWLIGLMLCVLGAFLYSNSQLSAQNSERQALLDENTIRLQELKSENNELKQTKAKIGTPAYLERQARTLYNYMSKDEIRLVIDNPEALYGEGNVPER